MAIGRYHPDHLAAGQATIMALYPASQNPWDFPELLDEGLMPHKVKELYISGAPHVNFFVDITSTMDKKIEALMCHQSQFIGRTAELEKMMRSRIADLGRKYWVEYAEEFHRTENR
jgi:LmbE family N-acetylglucosaminyl deacetylase